MRGRALLVAALLAGGCSGKATTSGPDAAVADARAGASVPDAPAPDAPAPDAPAPDAAALPCGGCGLGICDGDACRPARSCGELAVHPGTASGRYTIAAAGGGAHEVVCDMVTDGGGWTLFANLVSGGFDYASTISLEIGTTVTDADAFASKPADTVVRLLIVANDFAFDVKQSAPSAAFAPSTTATLSGIFGLDTLIGQTGAATVSAAERPFIVSTNQLGYGCGGSIVSIAGGHGSTLSGYAYDGSGASGCSGSNLGVVWVVQQIPGGDCGYHVKNTMELGEHLDCNNTATGVFATRFQLWFR